MKKLIYALFLLAGLAAAQTKVTPDCVIPFSFTTSGSTGNSTCGAPNGAPNGNGIASWIVVYYNTGFSGLSVTVQSAADNSGVPGTYGTFAGTVLTSSQYPGSSGVNPNTATTSAFTGLAGYYPWMRVTLSGLTGSGKVTGALYGFYNSTLAKAGSGGGGGGITVEGTANQIVFTPSDPCSSGTCQAALTTNVVIPGTFTTGSGSGVTGAHDFIGKTSGATSTLTVDDSNTATTVKLPNDTTGGLYLPTSPTATPAAGCAQYNGTSTELPSTGVPCGSGSGGVSVQVNGSAIGAATTINFAAGTNVTQTGSGSGIITVTTNSTGGATGGATNGYSAPAVALPTAGSTFIPPVGGALPSATEANVQWIAPVTATLSDLGVTLSAVPGTGNSISFTFRDGGVSQTVTCVITAAIKSCTDSTHSFSVTQGDLLDIQITTTGIVAIAPTIVIGYEYGGGGSGSSNQVYYFTDSMYNFAICSTSYAGGPTGTFGSLPSCSGSWTYYAPGSGVPVTPPPASGWTWDNQGSSTISFTNGPATMVAAAASGVDQMRVQYRTAPSTPYTITTRLTGDLSGGGMWGTVTNRRAGYGVAFSDSTGKYIIFYTLFEPMSGFNYSGGTFKWTSATSGFISAYNGLGDTPNNASLVQRQYQFMQISDDGTNLTFRFSTTGQPGTWDQFDQRPRTDYLTSGPTRVAWFTFVPSTAQSDGILMDWTVTSP